MTLLLHLSDPHFGTDQPQVLRALLALAHQHKPQVVVLSGDITQRAQPDEFDAARRFCDQLGTAALLSLPGNHDLPLLNLWKRLWRPYAAYLVAFGPRLEPVLDMEHWLVVGVNTTRAWRHKDGEVSDEQIRRVALLLQAARPGQLRVVVTHQPAVVSRVEDEHDRLRGADAALRSWSQAGADLVLGGHIHLPYVLGTHGVVPGVDKPLWCVQAGTAVSRRIRHGTCNSVNLIEWHAPRLRQPRQCAVQRWDWDAAAGAFALRQEDVLPLAPLT